MSAKLADHTWGPSSIGCHVCLFACLSASAQVHWIGIINSSIFVVSLTTVLAYIMLRILRRDYQRIDEDEEGP